jgi:hypothetical protein
MFYPRQSFVDKNNQIDFYRAPSETRLQLLAPAEAIDLGARGVI